METPIEYRLDDLSFFGKGALRTSIFERGRPSISAFHKADNANHVQAVRANLQMIAILVVQLSIVCFLGYTLSFPPGISFLTRPDRFPILSQGRGVEIDGQETFFCVFTLALIGDMKQQMENSGFGPPPS